MMGLGPAAQAGIDSFHEAAPYVESEGVSDFDSSADGQYLFNAYHGATNFIRVSSDFGAHWSITKYLPNEFVRSLAATRDGSTIYLTTNSFSGNSPDNTLGYIYKSSDFGQSWNRISGSNIYRWRDIDVSDDGTTLIAYASQELNSLGITVGRGYLLTSTDSGLTWNTRMRGFYRSVAISADGFRMAAIGNNITTSDYNYFTYGLEVWLSSDRGSTWNFNRTPSYGSIFNLAMSSDGMTIAITGERPNSWPGNIDVTRNFGTSWISSSVTRGGTTFKDSGVFLHVAISDDGSKILLSSRYYLYYSTDFGNHFLPSNFYIEGTLPGDPLGIQPLPEAVGVALNGNGDYAYIFVGNPSVMYATKAISDAPTNLTAAVNVNSVDLSWIAPSYTGDLPITDYRIEYSSDGGTTWVTKSHTAAASTSMLITGLTQGTSYNFRVAAVTGFGISDYLVLENIIPGLVPVKVSGLTAERHSQSVSLAWGPPSSLRGTAISNYVVQYSSNTGSTWTTFTHPVSTNRSITVTGLSNGTAYTFRVAATNSNGNGDFSDQTGTVIPATSPTAATNISAQTGNGTISIYWGAPADSGGIDVNSYLVSMTHDGGGQEVYVPSNQLSRTYTGLRNGWTYNFTVAAVTDVGMGPSSSISAIPSTEPAPPSSLLTSIGNSQISLTWTAPDNNGGASIINYLIEYSSDSGVHWSTFAHPTSTATSATITGLTNGTQYKFRVSATNINGTSNPSLPASATPSTTASAPTNLSGTAGNSEVSLAFTAGNVGGNPITDYSVEYSSDSGAHWNTYSHSPVSTSPIVVTGLTNYLNYIFRITPINTNGSGDVSAESLPVQPSGTLTSISLTRSSQGSAAGAAFSTQPVITLKDQNSARISSDSSTVVTASISNGGSLIGTVTATAAGGIATFTNLGISGTAGTSYTISYSVTGVASVSQNIVASIGAATQLKVTRSSSGAQTGSPFTVQPQISVLDLGNNIVSTLSATHITATQDEALCHGLISSDSATTVNGVATFSGYGSIAPSGTACVITYSSTSLTSTSETITVNSGSAAYIGRLVRPDRGYTGRAFGQQPIYTITDISGNVVTTDNSTVLTVTTPTLPGVTVLSGTATAVNGVVTFKTLGFSGVDSGTFVLMRVTANSFSAFYSDSIYMIPGGVTISLSVPGDVQTVGKGEQITVTAQINTPGRVRFLADGKVIPGCAAKYATTAARCIWKPSIQGRAITLTSTVTVSNQVTNSAPLIVTSVRRKTLRK